MPIEAQSISLRPSYNILDIVPPFNTSLLLNDNLSSSELIQIACFFLLSASVVHFSGKCLFGTKCGHFTVVVYLVVRTRNVRRGTFRVQYSECKIQGSIQHPGQCMYPAPTTSCPWNEPRTFRVLYAEGILHISRPGRKRCIPSVNVHASEHEKRMEHVQIQFREKMYCSSCCSVFRSFFSY